ncbi:hypothetical protein [Risungbinella massiliensis]|uniref:hypothetical protein n=1 Tax=Risungbinella massiliensis TaxID=1329796 RepID=UPI0005CC2E50|nr:hypothetical protein [Risungbinella massiliensis]
MLIENLHLVVTLSLLILFGTGWFTSLYPKKQTSRRHILYLLVACFFLYMLPAVPVTDRFLVHITMLILMIVCFTLVYQLSTKKGFFVLGGSAILGAVFSFWNYLNQIYPNSYSSWLWWIQLGISFLCAYLLGSTHVERWSFFFHILLYTHLADTIRALDGGEIITFGTSIFLSQVTVAFSWFVIVESFLKRDWLVPVSISRLKKLFGNLRKHVLMCRSYIFRKS